MAIAEKTGDFLKKGGLQFWGDTEKSLGECF
jgi:hypothetical protein